MQAVANLFLLEIEGVTEVEEEKSVGCYFYMDGHLYGSIERRNNEKPVSLPSEGVLTIEVKVEDEETVLIGHTTIDMNLLIGRSRICVNLTRDPALPDPIRLLLSAPSLPSIQESPETPLSQDDRDTFFQLSSTTQHMKILELESMLDRERRVYLANVEQFMTHHKAMQDRYQLNIDVLNVKLKKTTAVMEDMKTQMRTWGGIQELWRKQEIFWKEKLREFSENAIEAYKRFVARENAGKIEIKTLETKVKTLGEEKAALSETLIKNESLIFELTERIKNLQVKLLQVQSNSSVAKKMEDTVSTLSEEIWKLKASLETGKPKSKDDSRSRVKARNSLVTEHKLGTAPKTASNTRKKDRVEKVSSSPKEEVMTLSSKSGVLLVHTKNKEIPLSEFLRIHNFYPSSTQSSTTSPTGWKPMITSSLRSSPVLRKSAVLGPEMRIRKKPGTESQEKIDGEEIKAKDLGAKIAKKLRSPKKLVSV